MVRSTNQRDMNGTAQSTVKLTIQRINREDGTQRCDQQAGPTFSTLRTVPTVRGLNVGFSSRHVSTPHVQTPVDTLAAPLRVKYPQPLHTIKAARGAKARGSPSRPPSHGALPPSKNSVTTLCVVASVVSGRGCCQALAPTASLGRSRNKATHTIPRFPPRPPSHSNPPNPQRTLEGWIGAPRQLQNQQGSPAASLEDPRLWMGVVWVSALQSAQCTVLSHKRYFRTLHSPRRRTRQTSFRCQTLDSRPEYVQACNG